MDNERELLRQKFKAIRADYSPQWLAESSRAVCGRLLEWPEFTKAVNIMGYLAFGNEVAIDELLSQAIASGKKVYVPYITPDSQNIMRAAELSSLSELTRGRYGIRTPKNTELFAEPARLDLVLAPGLAFTEKGGRLGLGGGYYDRFLADLKETVKAGVTLTPQIARELPLSPTDAAMDFLASEKGITDCRQI